LLRSQADKFGAAALIAAVMSLMIDKPQAARGGPATGVTPMADDPIVAYPTTLKVKGGELLVRPITPADAPALVEMIHRADPEDVRSRFHVAMAEPPPSLIAKLTQFDYSQHMALAALMGEEIVCVARLVCDPGCDTGEFALAVRSDQQRRGIGRGMMGLLINYARARGMVRIWGSIEVENDRMLGLARELGFKPEGAAILGDVTMSLAL
jgi:acetyltransferase